MQLEAISSCPVASYLGEETNTHLTTASFKVVVKGIRFPLSLLCIWKKTGAVAEGAILL